MDITEFLAVEALTAMNKVKPYWAPDVRLISVGEILRRLTGNTFVGKG